MQSKDIEVGQDYLYQPYLRRYSSAYDYLGQESAIRARVVSAPAHGQVTFMVWYDGKKKSSGTLTEPVKNLIGPWAAHLSAFAEKQQWKAEAIARMQEHAATVQRLTGLKADDLPSGLDGVVSNDGSFSTRGRIGIEQLAAMLEVAYALGQQSAKGGA